VIELIYSSDVTLEFDGKDMRDLLEQARRNNAKFNVTGLLFFGSNKFIQILEGPEESVRQVYKNIRADTRHTNVTLLHEAEIQQRSFGSWLMSYEPLSEDDVRKIDGLPSTIKASEAVKIAQDDRKNYGSRLFGILTGATLSH